MISKLTAAVKKIVRDEAQRMGLLFTVLALAVTLAGFLPLPALARLTPGSTNAS